MFDVASSFRAKLEEKRKKEEEKRMKEEEKRLKEEKDVSNRKVSFQALFVLSDSY